MEIRRQLNNGSLFHVSLHWQLEVSRRFSKEERNLLKKYQLFLRRGFRSANSTVKKTKLFLSTVLRTKNLDNDTKLVFIR